MKEVDWCGAITQGGSGRDDIDVVESCRIFQLFVVSTLDSNHDDHVKSHSRTSVIGSRSRYRELSAEQHGIVTISGGSEVTGSIHALVTNSGTVMNSRCQPATRVDCCFSCYHTGSEQKWTPWQFCSRRWEKLSKNPKYVCLQELDKIIEIIRATLTRAQHWQDPDRCGSRISVKPCSAKNCEDTEVGYH